MPPSVRVIDPARLQGISAPLTENRFSRFLHRVLSELVVLQGVRESVQKKRLALLRRDLLVIIIAFRMDFNKQVNVNAELVQYPKMEIAVFC